MVSRYYHFCAVYKTTVCRTYFLRSHITEKSSKIRPQTRPKNNVCQTTVFRKKASPPHGRLVSSFSQMLIECTLPHTRKLGDLTHGILTRIVELHCSADFLAVRRWSAAFSPSGSGGREPLARSVSDHIALELSKRGDQRKEQLSRAARGVDRLFQRDQVHALRVEQLQYEF